MNCGYNVGLAFIQAHATAYDSRDLAKNQCLQKLHEYNAHLKDLSTLINALVQKKNSGKADFQSDPEMMNLIDRIRATHEDPSTHQSILPPHQYSWQSEKEIEAILQLLNDHVKILSGEINQTTMQLSQETQDTLQLTEISYKTIDMLIRHIESILAKMGR